MENEKEGGDNMQGKKKAASTRNRKEKKIENVIVVHVESETV